MLRDDIATIQDAEEQGFTGVLNLGIGESGGRSIARRQYHAGALKIIRPHYLDDTGQVYYTIVNPGGGYVGGDGYYQRFALEPGASAVITDQSATKVYRTPGGHVYQRMAFEVEAGGVLEYVPDQLILYRDADFRQDTVVKLAKDASFFMSEIVTPGWSPDKSIFGYEHMHLRTQVEIDGELALVDNLRIDPSSTVHPVSSMGFMGSYTHVASAICFDPQITDATLDAVRDALPSDNGAESSITATDEPGFVLRAVGNRTEDLMATVLAAVNTVRSQFRGQGQLKLRQY
ncbi:urease accessory protein [Corynebacterium appendicis CIP 107643]|uniref:Urease accessory protein UreD n=1 Tax=Corynebacterium appendicis CIP 107643 TaxID=1161099 RepID=A0A1N7JXH1_9CORY|nr:urease accessory protein UreD [Corynebacterium appendicis]WJY60586.1 Urease accessory protein UreD [Corynebacterium appendicis CIP 107643]SIS54017.1 urease accessory protein [Corynebacterium appendicis CIP 107643]